MNIYIYYFEVGGLKDVCCAKKKYVIAQLAFLDSLVSSQFHPPLYNTWYKRFSLNFVTSMLWCRPPNQ